VRLLGVQVQGHYRHQHRPSLPKQPIPWESSHLYFLGGVRANAGIDETIQPVRGSSRPWCEQSSFLYCLRVHGLDGGIQSGSGVSHGSTSRSECEVEK
jgi:hypothetical protein